MSFSDPPSSGRAAKRRVAQLKYRDRDYILGPGQYILGRAPSCFLIIDEPLVSRRHAELNVGHDSATVRDLDSVNGVLINGRQIQGPQMLAHGDRITLGKQDLAFTFATETPSLQARPSFTTSKPPSSRPSATTSAPSSGEVTKQADALELIGMVADRALEAGRTEQAEEMLKMHLKQVIEGARRGRPMSDATSVAGVRNALKLAIATGKGSWTDYGIELLSLKRIPCTDALVQQLREAVEQSDRVNAQQLEDYVRTQRSGAASLEELRIGQRLDETLRAAKTKRHSLL